MSGKAETQPSQSRADAQGLVFLTVFGWTILGTHRSEVPSPGPGDSTLEKRGHNMQGYIVKALKAGFRDTK